MMHTEKSSTNREGKCCFFNVSLIFDSGCVATSTAMKGKKQKTQNGKKKGTYAKAGGVNRCQAETRRWKNIPFAVKKYTIKVQKIINV